MEKISKARIKWIRSLQQKKVREQEGVFVVEGEKMVLEGLASKLHTLVALLVHKDEVAIIPQEFRDVALSADTTEMEQLSGLKTPNKLLAVFKRPSLQSTYSSFELALDSVQDPGNMGTILRLADWFGINRIVCSKETVDCYNPKVVQASMGAIFRIQVVYTDLLGYLPDAKRPVYGALLNGENYRTVSYKPDGILLMGNEGNGISEQLIPLITQAVTIPRFGAAESLNVATATAILLAEVRKDD
ncbi:MAG: RNA methyltransferase [Fluviicola sp.]|nr:RNA methyltransferase [Fluviicola sp.]